MLQLNEAILEEKEKEEQKKKEEEAAAAAQAAEALAAHNPRFCAVCLAEPDALQHYPFAASTVSAWDRTEPAMRAVCRALANPQI